MKQFTNFLFNGMIDTNLFESRLRRTEQLQCFESITMSFFPQTILSINAHKLWTIFRKSASTQNINQK